MRSAATCSASSVSVLQALRAACNSACETRNPSAARSTRSNFFDRSISALSPRARTSSMIAATAAPTSAEDSRFSPRKPANAVSKPGSVVFSHLGILGSRPLAVPLRCRRSIFARVYRLAARTPRGTKVAQLGLDALDLEPHCRPARKVEQHHAGGILARLEGQGQQGEHLILVARIEPLDASRFDPLEPQPRAPALEFADPGRRGTLPVKSIGNRGKAHVVLNECHVADADHRILEVAGKDPQILRIEGNQLQVLHTLASRSLGWPAISRALNVDSGGAAVVQPTCRTPRCRGRSGAEPAEN